MKTCKRFHIEDVEFGDHFRLGGGGDEDFVSPVYTVSRTYHSNHFGWVIETLDGGTLYLDDYDWAEFIS